MVAKALVAEECRKREAREAFPLNTIAISIHAAQEFTRTCQTDLDECELSHLVYVIHVETAAYL